jgi:hypothetical protein
MLDDAVREHDGEVELEVLDLAQLLARGLDSSSHNEARPPV